MSAFSSPTSLRRESISPSSTAVAAVVAVAVAAAAAVAAATALSVPEEGGMGEKGEKGGEKGPLELSMRDTRRTMPLAGKGLEGGSVGRYLDQTEECEDCSSHASVDSFKKPKVREYFTAEDVQRMFPDDSFEKSKREIEAQIRALAASSAAGLDAASEELRGDFEAKIGAALAEIAYLRGELGTMTLDSARGWEELTGAQREHIQRADGLTRGSYLAPASAPLLAVTDVTSTPPLAVAVAVPV
eukprot:CAMPEP_0173326938 /NCGR_PEP_ID=MMETSP1144-20121109/1335_1 /TAXON_ID=483371 /ORGANISM="non described non described, Strain CCMP2298" /LENGTH=243 /DNA_ID=CAMNT_0014271287 /DNA_START=296 /DNA_END=1023 /DNA_ORIENTATION=-